VYVAYGRHHALAVRDRTIPQHAAAD